MKPAIEAQVVTDQVRMDNWTSIEAVGLLTPLGSWALLLL
jgi:hypothetical protein